MVPLRQFATFSEEQELPLVWRRDRVPTLTVRADVTPGVLPDTVVGELTPKIAEFAAKLPEPYKVDTGGLYEESAVSRGSVFAVVPLMIVLMLIIMMFQLVSFRRLALVVGIMPLGLIGVVLTLLLFNRPLGFVAILGMLALIGMIAKNAVILIVQIETDRAEGKGVYDAVIASATGRMRPMMLAAMSTILGLLPIAPTVFWGPMAFAIMGGLLVATMLTLVLLPTLYVAVFGKETDARCRAAGQLPTAAAGQADRTWPPTCSTSTSPTSGSCSTRWTPRRSTSATSIPMRPTTSANGPRNCRARVRWRSSSSWERHSAPRQRRSRRAVGPRSLPPQGSSDSPQPARLAADGALQPAGRAAVPRTRSSSLPSRPRSMVQTERYAALIENSLVIGAWVALWRPIEIFLYDWWPIRARGQAVRPAEPDGRAHGQRLAPARGDDGPELNAGSLRRTPMDSPRCRCLLARRRRSSCSGCC